MTTPPVLYIHLHKDYALLSLHQPAEAKEKVQAAYGTDLIHNLIDSLDILLKRNKLNKSSIRLYELQSDLGAESTAYKITRAFAEALISS